MIDAHRGEVFAGFYDGEARLAGAHVRAGPLALLERVPPGAAFVGDGAVRYRQAILDRVEGARLPERSLFLAATLGRLASIRLAAGEGVPPAALRPLYLREAEIRAPAPRAAVPRPVG
jgi:tRNA A37 threonylcarbamoyladenosine modification protein TsaB